VQEAVEPIGSLDANAELVGVPRQGSRGGEPIRPDRGPAGQARCGERRVVADATTVGSVVDRTVTEELRELSSFDDLSDEVAT
jgi:hypothetical protein